MKATDREAPGLPRELPDIGEPPVRPEMESVTDVNGTVARFEMAYSPIARRADPFSPGIVPSSQPVVERA